MSDSLKLWLEKHGMQPGLCPEVDPEYVPAQTTDDLALWEKIHADLKVLRESEAYIRKLILRDFFSKGLVEGSQNKYPLAGRYYLQATLTVNRSTSIENITNWRVDAETGEDRCMSAGINYDHVFKWKPELNISYYRTLTAEQQAVVNLALEIKPGSVSLEIKKAR